MISEADKYEYRKSTKLRKSLFEKKSKDTFDDEFEEEIYIVSDLLSFICWGDDFEQYNTVSETLMSNPEKQFEIIEPKKNKRYIGDDYFDGMHKDYCFVALQLWRMLSIIVIIALTGSYFFIFVVWSFGNSAFWMLLIDLIAFLKVFLSSGK